MSIAREMGGVDDGWWGITNETAMEPMCKMVAKWMVNMYENISDEVRSNAWRKKGFEWY